MTRREAREQAFLLLFEKTFQTDSMEDIVETARSARVVEVDSFTMEVALGATQNIGEIDGLIERFAIKWEKKRISRVALSLMRMAVYEMLYRDDVPVSVAINEAVELAKRYAGEEDAAFINGILGSVSRQDAEAPQEDIPSPDAPGTAPPDAGDCDDGDRAGAITMDGGEGA